MTPEPSWSLNSAVILDSNLRIPTRSRWPAQLRHRNTTTRNRARLCLPGSKCRGRRSIILWPFVLRLRNNRFAMRQCSIFRLEPPEDLSVDRSAQSLFQ